tara:strand:+ start:578 stop:862 length:285 start_codon:yes stop_codon:yes gene_type:complete
MTDRIYYLEIETTDGSPPQQLFFIELADLTRELTWWHEATHLKSLRVTLTALPLQPQPMRKRDQAAGGQGTQYQVGNCQGTEKHDAPAYQETLN